MQGNQVSHYVASWLRTARWWTKGNVSVLLMAMLVSLTGCPKYIVIIDVPVKPKFIPPGNIKEVDVRKFEGPLECVGELQNGIQARAANGGFNKPIPGLPDLEGALDINGTVEACSIRMGYGVLNATMRLSHGGKQLHQEILREETNRPGASMEEVRATLVERTVKHFAAIFVPGRKSELREVRPRGGSDPGWVAAREKNWELAVEFWTKWIGEDSKDARPWYNRGIAYEGLWAFKEAVADFKNAMELDRDEVYAQELVRAEKSRQDFIVIDSAKKARE